MMIDTTTNTQLYNHIKSIKPDWVNFVDDNKPCKTGLIQLYSLGSQYHEQLSIIEQGDELLKILKGELENERMLQNDMKCKVNVYSVNPAMIRYDGFDSFFEQLLYGFKRKIHTDDSWRIKVKYYIG